MAIPTKKMYDRKGKLIFDPNNPEDVKNYRKTQPLIEAFNLVRGLTDPRTGGGLTGATRVISKAANARMSKSKFTQNKAKQLADLVTKPMTRGKKAVTKKATPTVKEIVETKPTIPTNIPTTMELAQIPGSSVKTIKEGIKSFKDTKGKFTPKDTERVAKAREILNQPIAGTMRPSTIPQGFKSPFANTSLRKYIPEANPYKDFNKFKLDGDIVNKPLSNLIEGSIVVGGLGLGAGLMSSDSRLNSPKVNNKQTTGPVDLKRIDKSKLKPSKVEGVYITSALVDGEMKDFGIKWNNTTKGWEYYKGDGKPVVKTTPKQEIVKENTGGGGYTPIKDNKKTTGTGGGGNQTTTTGGGGGTKTPVKPTVAPVTSTYVGDEYYKANPDLEKAIQEDSIRQQREMYLEKIATKPLSSIVFKPTSKAVDVKNVMDEQDALRSIRADNKLPLKKKRYGGNLAMLKYMK